MSMDYPLRNAARGGMIALRERANPEWKHNILPPPAVLPYASLSAIGDDHDRRAFLLVGDGCGDGGSVRCSSANANKKQEIGR
jgi:hypothetical protein